MIIPVAVYLWIMQVENFSTFPNIPTLLWRLSKVHFGWRQWLRKKVFGSKDITPTMAFLRNQKYSFSGVGAKHQNGVAERNIKTVAQWARANMLHLATHWPQHANSTYWPQAINCVVWVFNRLPNMASGKLQMKSGQVSALHAPSYLICMSSGARFMYLTRLFKTERKYQTGVLAHVLGYSWVSQICIPLRFL